MTTTPTTDPNTRTHVGYIPEDLPLPAALALVLPYELPRSAADCLRRTGKPGRPIAITVQVQEL